MRGTDSRFPGVVIGDIVDERIVMGHGAGGRKMHRLIRKVFARHFGNEQLVRYEDGAVLPGARGKICMSTDSYVVQPLFFPGGDIGKLAVCGTVNDLAVMGARPLFMSVGFVIREGLPVDALERICRSIGRECRSAGVRVVTGDTKVIERGSTDEVYVNTTGIGAISRGARLGAERVRPGDVLIINGDIGEHESAVGIARGSYRLRSRVLSDCAPLDSLLLPLLSLGAVRLMRDPTRGGLATTLNEFAEATGLGFIVDEAALPVSQRVRAIASMLGLDPLYMASEGKAVIVAAPGAAPRLLSMMRRHRLGKGSRVIGAVAREPDGVWLKTGLGSLRRLIMLEGEQLPRIC